MKTILILGDVTDAKDGHSAELVNRVVASIRMLAKVARVVILAGNHDWLRKGQEFFRFLDGIDGVRFVTEPWEDDDLKGEPAMFLPYSKSPAADWKGLDFSHYRYLFMHQTVEGSVASNGQRMHGEALPDLSSAGKVYSGDIHVPQTIGPVEYVGSPYHVHFGDKFEPRVLLLEKGGKAVDLRFKTISRITVLAQPGGLSGLRLGAGDQVKLRIRLTPEERHDWAAIKRAARETVEGMGGEVHGIEMVAEGPGGSLARSLPARASRTPAEDVARFVRAEELGGSALDLALDIIEGTK